MSDFWIKVEKSTPDKPEVFQIAAILNLDPDLVLGKLIRAWSWLDSNSEDGHIKCHAQSVTNVLKPSIDRVTGVQGFSEAMEAVGWLEKNSIPNFDRHLGKSAKKRANDAERKRKSREKSEECHAQSVTEIGLDKSRVDKNKDTIVDTGVSTDSSDDSNTDKPPSCPHAEIIAAYHEILPELDSVVVSLWKPSTKRYKWLQARWRESDKHQSIKFWRAYFSALRKHPFYLGENDRGWKANLEWVVKQENFIKLIEKFRSEAKR